MSHDTDTAATAKLRIERLGHLGDGVAAGPVYVAGALPGEEVEGVLHGERLEDMRILTPSAQRVKPPCRHAKRCGGCAMQHASPALVASWKEEVVRGALRAQGVSAERFLPVTTSAPHSRRRANLAARRTKGGALLGFHARGSETIIPIEGCQLLHPALMSGLAGLEALVRLGVARGHEASLLITQSSSGLDVVLRGGKEADAALRMALAEVVETYGFARLTWDSEVIALRAMPLRLMGNAQIAPPPGAFLQATDHGEAALLAAVRRAIGPSPATLIVDLFAGCGTFALPLAQDSALRAYEGDSAMVEAMTQAARHSSGLRPFDAQTRDLFRRPLEPDELKGVGAVVMDPPRAGALAQCTVLARAPVPRVAMVSCNPQSFARDVRLLCEGGYHVDWVQVVDQFRWSTHIEMVACLVRR